MRIIVLLLSVGLFSCTNDKSQSETPTSTITINTKAPKAKLWDLGTLRLIKKEHLWHFETKEGRGIDVLGTWDTVSVVAVNRSKTYSRITFEQDTVDYILRSRLKDNRFSSFYLLAKDSLGVEYLLPSITARYYKVATSLERLDAKTEALWLHNSALSTLSDDILEHSALKVVALLHTPLEKISEQIASLHNLEQLYIQYNKVPLHFTANSWNALQALRVVNFSHTNLVDFENSLPSTTVLEHLEYLDLSVCQLTHVPEQIFAFKNLSHLKLSSNREIKHLSPNIGQLTLLQYLNLRGTSLSSLPKTLENLTNLHYFNTNYTRLKMLSIDLNSFPKLTSFYTTVELAQQLKTMYPDIYITSASSYE